MKPSENHAFYATRKGTPKGQAGDWWKYCDVCGARKDDPQHIVSQEVADENVLKAIRGDHETE